MISQLASRDLNNCDYARFSKVNKGTMLVLSEDGVFSKSNNLVTRPF